MYFKKLELIGFKSFCNKTTLHFEPGITAVVGPNGCGKSNIFDSIRWVLGEQSVKSLRGSNMEDVIFNGTDTKEPVGMAEVSLTFDNTNKFFAVESDEVTISRRLFRSGESEYLLNKTQVRLKDILDILLGTGIGAESYSIVPQGKIDMILSSRPEDRRMIFDEASGITKYKAQKREALRRLEETEQNLLRVNDIITEVKRQIGSLERQANKARKYKDTFEELKNKELVLGILQKNEINKLKIQISENINALTQEESRLSQIIKGQEDSISGSQSELKTLEEQILTVRTQIITLENLITRSKERIELNKERMNELDTNQASLAAQAEQSKSRLLTDGEKLNLLRLEYANLKNNIESKTAIFKEKDLLLNNISEAIKSSLENITSYKKSILDILTQATQAKNELIDSNSQQQIQIARKKRLEIERAKINEEHASSEGKLSTTKQELDQANAEYTTLDSRASALKNSLEEEKNTLKSIGQIIEELEKQKLSLESQKQFIQELRTKYDDISEAMNAVVYLDKLPNEKISGLVVRITDTSDQGNTESNYRIRASGEAKPFDLDTQKITEKILGLQENINTLKNNQIDKQTVVSGQENELVGLHDQLRAQETTLANKKASYQVILDQFNRLNEEFNLTNLELAEVETDLASLSQKNSGLETRLSKLDNEQKTKEALITSEQNNISINNSQKEGALVIITQIKTELEALAKRINSDDVNLKALEERYNQDKQNVLSIETQINDCVCKHKILESENEELGNKIIQTNLDIVDQSTSLKETEAKFQGISSGISEIIKRIDTDKQSLDGLKNRIYQLQVQDKDTQYKYLALNERLSQAYKIDLEQLSGTSLLEVDLQQINIETLSEEINRLKEKVNSYGSVNLVAIEEYDELKKRYDFLNQQQTDLVTAKDSLREAISKINRTTKQMFLETFEKVRVEFRNYFKLLFNGGDAQIYLIDEQDPLESGIEIICRPPGKKLQNVLLLSGGEKSMSAIALIFAIFKIKPAPFCVLDEIDAALDEANVDRFGRALQDFSQISQFIVITHNKKTIANANIMYGITMEESGVSKIVSVKFSQDKPAKESKPDTQAIPEPV